MRQQQNHVDDSSSYSSLEINELPKLLLGTYLDLCNTSLHIFRYLIWLSCSTAILVITSWLHCCLQQAEQFG